MPVQADPDVIVWTPCTQRSHIFYAIKAGVDTVARPENTSTMSVLREMDAAKLAERLKPGTPLIANLDSVPWRAQPPTPAKQIDGLNSIVEVCAAMVVKGSLPERDAFQEQFERTHLVLTVSDDLLLRFRPGR